MLLPKNGVAAHFILSEWILSPGDSLSMSVIAFYEKVIKVKADVAAFLINCFPSA